MRRAIDTLVIVAMLFAIAACAIDAEGEQSEEEVVTDSAAQELAEPVLAETGKDIVFTYLDSAKAAELAETADGVEPPIGPACGTLFYADGCTQAHQACRCRNTGWAGFCAWETDLCNFYLFCHCD